MLGLIAALAAAAQAWAVGSPPLITDDPGTPGNGHWEINVGVATEQRPDVKLTEFPQLDINYGIGERVELTYELPYLVQSGEGQRLDGLGNSSVSVKWRFYDAGEGGLAVSVYPGVEFYNPGSSSKDRGVVDRAPVYRLPVQLEKDLGPVTLNLEFGREFHPQDDLWLYGVALSHRVNKQFEFGVEAAGEAATRLNRSRLALNVGFVVDLSERDSLMFSIGRELHNHDEARASLLAYVGWQVRL